MTPEELRNLDDAQYGDLFDVERSALYHSRRRAFFSRWHLLTTVMTILMAGAYVVQAGFEGKPPWWLNGLSWVAGTLALLDLCIKFPQRMAEHFNLQKQFDQLARKMRSGPAAGSVWEEYSTLRSVIEEEEPAVYKIVDALSRNELLIAKGFTRENTRSSFAKTNIFQRLTSNYLRWENYDPSTGGSL